MTEETEYLDIFKKILPKGENRMRPERMVELGMIHELAEFNTDMDAILDSLVEVPVYELHPIGVRITGRDAVRVFYERTLHIFQQFDQRKEVQTRIIGSIAYGDRHMCVEMSDEFRFPNGEVRMISFLAAVEYREDGMYGERLYADKDFSQVVEDALGPDFFLRPDVTKI